MSVDWDRLTELFGAARLLDEASRAAFLDLACAGDSDMRAQLDAMLSADAVDDSFLAPLPHASIAEAFVPSSSVIAKGQVLKDRYVIDEPFGSGGQALVYRATDRVLSRPVVVKVMRAIRPLGVALKARFEQEMMALSRIDHPGVVGILDVGELDDGSPFLVIQYIQGVSLRELIRQGRIEPARCAHILSGIAAALSAAHAVGIAHQDLKPENVMVQRLSDGSEAVKLIDFGIAKVDRLGSVPDVTTVMIVGSVRYMAPEQFEGRNVPASDTYALGILACELLCGQPDVRALPKSLDREVRRAIESAVAFRPDDRPRDVKAWAHELAAALADRNRRRRILSRVAVAAAAVAVSSIALAMLARESERVDRIIEKVGAFDPVSEGFLTHNVIGTIISDVERTGYIGWTVSSRAAGGEYYYQPLSEAQKRRALSRGWRLSAVMRADEGAANLNVDFGSAGRRFDINVAIESEADLVRLNTEIVPKPQGLELRLPRAHASYRKYELRYDVGLETAGLWIDGEERLTGYRGHNQFVEDKGVMFGAARHKSDVGTASFQSVRFEINP